MLLLEEYGKLLNFELEDQKILNKQSLSCSSWSLKESNAESNKDNGGLDHERTRTLLTGLKGIHVIFSQINWLKCTHVMRSCMRLN